MLTYPYCWSFANFIAYTGIYSIVGGDIAVSLGYTRFVGNQIGAIAGEISAMAQEINYINAHPIN